MAPVTEELARWEGRHESSGEGVGGTRIKKRIPFVFVYKKYEWHI